MYKHTLTRICYVFMYIITYYTKMLCDSVECGTCTQVIVSPHTTNLCQQLYGAFVPGGTSQPKPIPSTISNPSNESNVARTSSCTTSDQPAPVEQKNSLDLPSSSSADVPRSITPQPHLMSPPHPQDLPRSPPGSPPQVPESPMPGTPPGTPPDTPPMTPPGTPPPGSSPTTPPGSPPPSAAQSVHQDQYNSPYHQQQHRGKQYRTS